MRSSSAWSPPRTYGHVGGLAVYDPSTAPGGKLEMADVCRMVVRAPAPAAAVPLAARRGAVRHRPPLLGRGPRLRPRLPHPRQRGAAARRRPAARRDRRADLRAAAGPLAPAVGAVPDPRPARGARGDADQAAPLDGRRRVGQRDPRRAARPEPGGQGDPARAGAHAPASACPAISRCSGAGCSASRASRCARCARCRRRCRTSPTCRAPTRSPSCRGSRALASALLAGPRRGPGGCSRSRPRGAPKTSFNGRVSPHRRFAFGSLSLDTVKRLKNELGITVNDVVVALCATAVRDWLLDRDELPEEPLVAMIPVSVRTEEQIGHVRQPGLDDDRPDPDQRGGPARAAAARPRVPARARRSATRRCPPTC